MSNLFYQQLYGILEQACLQPQCWAVSELVVIIVLLVMGGGHILLLTRRDRAMRREQLADFEQQRDARRRELQREEEQRAARVHALHALWDAVYHLQYHLYGTTWEAQNTLWEQTKAVPRLVVPERNRLYYVELMAIMRGLSHLGFPLESARVEQTDLDFYASWVAELEARFRACGREKTIRQRWQQVVSRLCD